MCTHSAISFWTKLGLCMGLLVCSTALAQEVLDDFESYPDGKVLGDGFMTHPWCRFGTATNDNVVATNQKGRIINGAMSAQYCVYWPNKFGAIRYTLARPTDLTGYSAIKFSVRACDVAYASDADMGTDPDSHTWVNLAICDGTTTFESKMSHPVSLQPSDVITYLTESVMVRVDGSGSFEQVLSQATQIGMTFRSEPGMLYTETLVVDDLKLLTTQVATGQNQTLIIE